MENKGYVIGDKSTGKFFSILELTNVSLYDDYYIFNSPKEALLYGYIPSQKYKLFKLKVYNIEVSFFKEVIKINKEFPPSDIFLEKCSNLNKKNVTINRVINNSGGWIIGVIEDSICFLQPIENSNVNKKIKLLKEYYSSNLIVGVSPIFMELHSKLNSKTTINDLKYLINKNIYKYKKNFIKI